MSSPIKLTARHAARVGCMLCLLFTHAAQASDSEVRKLLLDAIKKALSTSQTPALDDKDLENVKLVFELEESKKVLAEDPSVFDFLKDKPIPPLQPERLTQEVLNSARNLDARKSMLVGFLVKNGAAAALQPKGGRFPGAEVLASAAQASGSQSVKALLEAGCDAQVKSVAGGPALAAAARNAWIFPESVPLLLKSGAPAFGSDNSSLEPLMALLENYRESATPFAATGSSRKDTPPEGEIAAILANCESTLKLLMKSEAATTNALKRAIQKGYPKAFAQMLLSPGAPDNTTLLKWLISEKLGNSSYDAEAFASIKDSLSKRTAAAESGAGSPAAQAELPRIRAFFLGETREHGAELWTTDGTTEGTKMVVDLEPGPHSPLLKDFAPVEGGMCFLGETRERKLSIYRVSNDAAHVDSMDWEKPISEVSSAENRMILYYKPSSTPSGFLWQTDGTPNGTLPIAHDKFHVSDVYPKPKHFFFWTLVSTQRSGNPEIILAELKPAHRQIIQHAKVRRGDGFDGRPFLVAPKHFVWFLESGMWAVEHGSAAAPKCLFEGRQIRAYGNYEQNHATAKDLLFFPAEYYVDGSKGPQTVNKYGVELWCTDGTIEGTRMLRDILSTPGDQRGSSPASLTSFGNRVIFTANDGTHGQEPWLSDGTEQGTQLLMDLNPGPGGSSARAFSVLGDKVVFLNGDAIWVTDGTESGTLRIKSCSGLNSSTLIHAGSCLLFTAYGDGGNGQGLWRTDGTPMGTRYLKEVSIRSPITMASPPATPAPAKP